MSRATRATIHLSALRHNLQQVRACAPTSKVMAVVKADGYGHGLERVVQALEGADAFGVASIADAQRIRAMGLSKRIVLLSGIDEPADIAEVRRLQLDIVLHHETQLQWLAQASAGLPIKVWIKLDSGMHRLGFAPSLAKQIYQRILAMPSIDPDIVWMTHFANSDELQSPDTPNQIASFFSAIENLPGAKSLSNSAGVLAWPQAHNDWVRAGGMLYGISVIKDKFGADFGLQAAMSLTTRIIAINRVKKGERIGYGGAFVCPEEMNIGVAAIGYGDGYPRNISQNTPTLVNNQSIPIIGRVSMDLMTLDLRHQENAKVGDTVLLWGEGLPVEIIAEHAGTIAYELVCSITRRVNFVEA